MKDKIKNTFRPNTYLKHKCKDSFKGTFMVNFENNIKDEIEGMFSESIKIISKPHHN